MPSPLPAGAVVVVLCAPRNEPDDAASASQCLGRCPGRCLVIACSLRREEAISLLRQEVGGIFDASNPLAELPAAIRTVAGGGKWLDARHVKLLVEASVGREEGSKLPARERAVLNLVLEGLSNKEIGQRIGLSEASVKAALQRLFRKSGVRTRSQLVRAALGRPPWAD